MAWSYLTCYPCWLCFPDLPLASHVLKLFLSVLSLLFFFFNLKRVVYCWKHPNSFSSYYFFPMDNWWESHDQCSATASFLLHDSWWTPDRKEVSGLRPVSPAECTPNWHGHVKRTQDKQVFLQLRGQPSTGRWQPCIARTCCPGEAVGPQLFRPVCPEDVGQLERLGISF